MYFFLSENENGNGSPMSLRVNDYFDHQLNCLSSNNINIINNNVPLTCILGYEQVKRMRRVVGSKFCFK